MARLFAGNSTIPGSAAPQTSRFAPGTSNGWSPSWGRCAPCLGKTRPRCLRAWHGDARRSRHCRRPARRRWRPEGTATSSGEDAFASLTSNSASDDDGTPTGALAGEKIPFPVGSVAAIYCFGKIDIDRKLVSFLSKYNVPVFFFGYYGYYTATLYPKEHLLSGRLKVAQVAHLCDPENDPYRGFKMWW